MDSWPDVCVSLERLTGNHPSITRSLSLSLYRLCNPQLKQKTNGLLLEHHHCWPISERSLLDQFLKGAIIRQTPFSFRQTEGLTALYKTVSLGF